MGTPPVRGEDAHEESRDTLVLKTATKYKFEIDKASSLREKFQISKLAEVDDDQGTTRQGLRLEARAEHS